MDIVQCKKCGRNRDVGRCLTSYCPYCGPEDSEATQATPPEDRAPLTEETVAPSAPESKTAEPKAKRGGRKAKEKKAAG